MRIVQIIDSLEAGGAERMAINYANSLSKNISFSGLVVSRKEGLLVNQIDQKVSYLFLKKRKTIDFIYIDGYDKYFLNKLQNYNYSQGVKTFESEYIFRTSSSTINTFFSNKILFSEFSFL